MGRSMTNQVAQMQKETTPGTAITDAMMRVLSMKLIPAYSVNGGQSLTAAGSSVPTSYQVGDVWSTWSVEGTQDFNAMGLILSSLFGTPVTTPVVGSVGAFTHVWEPDAFAPKPFVSYTAQFGDSVHAMQAAMFVFQMLGLTIQRGTLGLTSSGISRKVDHTATLASTGVTNLAAVPIPSRGYNVYADDTWATLGTTKLLACYSAEISNPDMYVPDSPINSEINGFESLMEAQDRELTTNFTVGFDAAGADLIDSFENETHKFFRIEAEGTPVAETVTNYRFAYDVATRLIGVGQPTAAPNSPTVVLPMEGRSILDDVSNKFMSISLTNGVASY